MPDCPSTDPRCQHTRATDYGNYGCRCPGARTARERQRKQRHLRPPRYVDATGARRRIQALMAIGHSQNDLAQALGRKRAGSLGPFLWQRGRHQVTYELHERIRQVYEQLWDKPGTGKRAALVSEHAAAKGWPPPLWWDDDVIDDPHFQDNQGYKPVTQLARRPLAERNAERRAEVLRLTLKGRSAAEIADELGVTPRTVIRDRAVLRRAVDGMQVAS